MQPQNIFVIVLSVCLLNGLLSPYLLVVYLIAPLWLPDYLPMPLELRLYVSSLALSTATLFVSGVPAALYERLSGLGRPTSTAMYIWLVGAIVLSLPSLNRLNAL